MQMFATLNCSISHKTLLDWVNETLKCELRSIKELCTGAAYCQMMDILFPGCISLDKIKFLTNQEYEYIQNFDLLQKTFVKLNITKPIGVLQLVKGGTSDNFVFAQWFKKFYDSKYVKRVYDPIRARRFQTLGISRTIFGKPRSKSACTRGDTSGKTPSQVLRIARSNTNEQDASSCAPEVSCKTKSILKSSQSQRAFRTDVHGDSKVVLIVVSKDVPKADVIADSNAKVVSQADSKCVSQTSIKKSYPKTCKVENDATKVCSRQGSTAKLVEIGCLGDGNDIHKNRKRTELRSFASEPDNRVFAHASTINLSDGQNFTHECVFAERDFFANKFKTLMSLQGDQITKEKINEIMMEPIRGLPTPNTVLSHFERGDKAEH